MGRTRRHAVSTRRSPRALTGRFGGPFRFSLPEDAQGGAAVANAGAPSPAPVATAAAPPLASAPAPALAPAVSLPFSVSVSLVTPQESPLSLDLPCSRPFRLPP